MLPSLTWRPEIAIEGDTTTTDPYVRESRRRLHLEDRRERQRPRIAEHSSQVILQPCARQTRIEQLGSACKRCPSLPRQLIEREKPGSRSTFLIQGAIGSTQARASHLLLV